MPTSKDRNIADQKTIDLQRNSLDNATNRVLIQWKDILENYIKPLIPGSMLFGPYMVNRKPKQLVSIERNRKLRVYLPTPLPYFFVLQKQVAFAPQEKMFLEGIIERLHRSSIASSEYFHLLAGGIIEYAIAEHVDKDHSKTIYNVLQVYNQWSTQTYEGKKFSHITGITLYSESTSSNDFFSLRNQDFIKSMGASGNTLISLNADGGISGIEQLNLHCMDEEQMKNILAPVQANAIATWTEGESRCAVQLTQSGEILLFKEGKLIFAKRRFHWHSFPHSMILQGLRPTVHYSEEEKKLQKAVYLTAIDVAFQEHGACIGVILGSDQKKREALRRVSSEYLFSSKTPSPTAKLLESIVANKKFYELSRDLRVELCSIDGAVIMDSTGVIFTVGAILKTKGNAKGGGGRTSAAVALAKTGYGIKVSEDGYIEIYKGINAPLSFA